MRAGDALGLRGEAEGGGPPRGEAEGGGPPRGDADGGGPPRGEAEGGGAPAFCGDAIGRNGGVGGGDWPVRDPGGPPGGPPALPGIGVRIGDGARFGVPGPGDAFGVGPPGREGGGGGGREPDGPGRGPAGEPGTGEAPTPRPFGGGGLVSGEAGIDELGVSGTSNLRITLTTIGMRFLFACSAFMQASLLPTHAVPATSTNSSPGFKILMFTL